MNIKVVLEPSDEGGYTVFVPTLPGCISEGETIDEAVENIREAIKLYLEPLEEELIIEQGAIVKELVL
ncbi:type II toxin-antitoxin system HicB family antitoxin [Nostoc sp.]|jgi:predicted RNase H-like HicB family nuclease|uniref:type II toxin-antitoxin system HicB family antitoxin n=1 Tax=Nostoc sp. TaxID=1180 RepID=UPI002FFAB114